MLVEKINKQRNKERKNYPILKRGKLNKKSMSNHPLYGSKTSEYMSEQLTTGWDEPVLKYFMINNHDTAAYWVLDYIEHE